MDNLDKATRERTNKNLKSFKKGKSGNKNGAPKGKHLSTLIQDFLDSDFKATDPFTKKKENKTLAEWLSTNLIAKAIKGNMKAVQIIFERLEGKVADNLNIKVNDSAQIEAIKAKMYEFEKHNGEEKE